MTLWGILSPSDQYVKISITHCGNNNTDEYLYKGKKNETSTGKLQALLTNKTNITDKDWEKDLKAEKKISFTPEKRRPLKG